MIRPTNLIYLVTRAHGLSTHLLSRDEIILLARSRDLNAFIEGLMRSDYAEDVGAVSREEVNARTLNKIFSDTYVRRLLYLLKVASGNIKSFLDAYTRRVEVDNIKRISRAKFHGLDIDISELIQLPRVYSPINFQAMVEAETLEDSLSLLGFTMYKGVVEYISISRELNSTLPIESYLDKVYYINLHKKMGGIVDRDVVLNIIGVEVDLRNIYYIVSYKILDIPHEMIESAIIRPVYRFKDEHISNMIRARIDGVLDVLNLTPYKDYIERLIPSIEAKSIDKLEYELSKIFKDLIDKIALRNPLGLGYILWYLNSINYECRNLMTIAFGKELGVTDLESDLIL